LNPQRKLWTFFVQNAPQSLEMELLSCNPPYFRPWEILKLTPVQRRYYIALAVRRPKEMSKAGRR